MQWRAAGATQALTKRESFKLLQNRNPEVAADLAARHPGNNDSFAVARFYRRMNGFYVADGVGDGAGAADASRLAVVSVAKFFEHRRTWRERPETVAEMAPDAFAYADSRLGGLRKAGATTLEGVVMTADPSRPVGVHIGDSRRLHVRDGQIIGQTVDQAVSNPRGGEPGQDKTWLANRLAGKGRLQYSDAEEIIRRRELPSETPLSLFIDQVEIVEGIQKNDMIVLHTDGIRERVSSPSPLPAERVAREAWEQRQNGLQKAATAILALPDKYTGEARWRAAAERDMALVFLPGIDDATAVVAQLS